MYGTTYSLGFHWQGFQFALALMSLDNFGKYKILDLLEANYNNENEIEKHIQSMMECAKIKQAPLLKLIDKVVAEEIFQRHKYGYYLVECDLEIGIKRLNLKLQNGSVVLDLSIAGLVLDKLQRCTDYKMPGASVAALAIALHNFYQPDEIIRVNPNSRDFGNFKF